MSKNICFIGDKNEKVLPYLNDLRDQGYEIHVNQYNLSKFVVKLQKKKIKLILIGHDDANEEFYQQFLEMCRDEKSISFLQKIPIIAISFKEMSKSEPIANVVDDVVFLPGKNLDEKISAWMYMAEEKQSESTWTQRTFLLDDKLERVRKNLRRGNLGLAVSNLTQIQTVLQTLPSKQDEVRKLSIILEAISVLIEKGQTLPLISQINTIEITPVKWEQDDGTTQKTTRAKEELTRALSIEEFRKYRKDNVQEDEIGDKDSVEQQTSEQSLESDEVTNENLLSCLDKAAILAKNKQVNEALEIYNKILEFDPKNEPCRIGRSRLFIENKAYGNAIDEANEILVHNPENYQSICHRGVARYYTGELDHCIKDLSVLVEKGIHNFMSYSTRGKAYYHKKLYTKAIEDLSESISRASDFVKGYIYRGRAHLHLGNYNEAICDLQKALEINPEFPNRDEVQTLIEIAEQKREEKKDE